MDINKIGKIINIGDIQKKGISSAERLVSSEIDKVSISPLAKELSNRDMAIRFAQALMESIPDMRQDKVELAKAHLAKGYDAEEVAGRLLGVTFVANHK
ncbi:flagellar biosynthesis anti-sigma factor FlgM [bacterium]|nr:flagellar biosynthesis anti-sigma factor FlgM [bacterium]MBU1600089.1 flagellar biosynthesis anti-sigma factor FlgM [bacterium]